MLAGSVSQYLKDSQLVHLLLLVTDSFQIHFWLSTQSHTAQQHTENRARDDSECTWNDESGFKFEENHHTGNNLNKN